MTFVRRVAVTGATGFVGRHVINALSGRGVKIFAITRNEKKIGDLNGVTSVEMDMAAVDSNCYERIGRPDVLIHLAWDGLPNYKSLSHFENELPQQFNFLKCLVQAGLPTLLVVGSCFEYGLQSGELSESMPTFPVTPYGYAKDALRRQLEFMKAEKAYSLTWARLFYLYGEGQSETSLLPLLRNAVSRGEKIFNMTGGEQLRDYLPVTTAAREIVDLGLYCPDSGIVNVCSGRPVSVRKLAEKWVAENNWQIELNFGIYPYPDYEPLAFWGSKKKLSHLLGEMAAE